MSDTESQQCSNIWCDREATKEFILIGVTDEPHPYCDEHAAELRQIERQEDNFP